MVGRTRRQPARRQRPGTLSPWPFVAIAWMAGMAFVDVFSHQFLPWWGVAGLLVSWVVLFVLTCRWFTRAPERVLAPPALATTLWLGAVLLAV